MTNNEAPRWCRSSCDCGRERGSADRYQMRAYAVAVAIAANGASVCHCGTAVSITSGEVDRTDGGCYRPGYVVMTCEPCNNDRTNVEEFDTVAFQADILRASIGIEIPKKAEAKRLWEAANEKGMSLKKSKYMKK